MNDNAAIEHVEREYDGLRLAVTPNEARFRLQQLQAFVKSVMKAGVDYGVIPGTGDKPTLFQAGAQKLAEIYGLSHRYVEVSKTKDWDRGFFEFEYRCELTSRRDGRYIGEGIGSCNSRESKYAGRWVGEHELPSGMDKSTLRTRTESAWLWESKLPPGTDKDALLTQERKGKNGGKYIVYQLTLTQYMIPNDDICSLVNTLQKMAAKRAYVAAVISVTRSSALFTQDVEDLPASAFGERAATPVAEVVDPETGEIRPADASPNQTARFAQRMGEIASSDNLHALKRAWDACNSDARSTAITLEQRGRLMDAKERRKDEIVKRQRRGPEGTDPSMDVGDDPAGLA